MLRTLANFLFNGGYNSSSSKLDQPLNTMASGSQNYLITGIGKLSTFLGLKIVGSATGSKVMMNAGDDYAGLGDHSETGIGSVFRVLGAFFFIGAGKLYVNGTNTSATASTTLQLKKVVSGSLGTTYQAGLAQPSAPVITAITPPSGYTGKNNGVVSVKIARVRAATGARSNASLSSNVIQCTNQSVSVTFPSADSNGQDYWEIDVTKNGEGAVGNHFFLQELPESVLTETVTASATLDADATINLPNDTLTSEHIGWLYRAYQTETNTVVAPAGITSSGNARAVVTAAGMTNSPKTVTVALTAAAHTTDVLIATAFRTALNADADVSAFFTVGGSGADITLTAKTAAANDATMNFTIEDVTSAGITDDVTSTNTVSGDTLTYVTAVGADDSGGAGSQQITLAAASVVTGTQSATFIRGIGGVARTYAFEWKDADIIGSDLAPIRDYPPPAAIFGGATGDVVFVDGAYGDTVDITQYAKDNSISGANTTLSTVGNAIAVSDPAKPESFPPDNYIFTGDAPTAILPGGNGVHWRFAENSLGVIRYVGGSPAVSYERIWTGIGVRNQNACVLGAGGRLYAYTGQRGAVRLGLGGEPDTLFAAPVADDMASWTAANVVLGYDANNQYVLFAHGSTILAYYEPLGVWCAPLTVSGSVSANYVVKSAVTIGGNCYMSFGDGSGLAVYNFNEYATGAQIAVKAFTPWVASQGVFDTLSRTSVAMRGDNGGTVSVKYYINGSATASATQTFTIGSNIANFNHTTVLRPNIRSAKSFRISVENTTEVSYTGVEQLKVEGITNMIAV